MVGQLVGAWLGIGRTIQGENLLDLPSPTFSCELVGSNYTLPKRQDFGYTSVLYIYLDKILGVASLGPGGARARPDLF